VEERVPGSHTLFVRNPTYWGDAPEYAYLLVTIGSNGGQPLDKNNLLDLSYGKPICADTASLTEGTIAAIAVGATVSVALAIVLWRLRRIHIDNQQLYYRLASLAPSVAQKPSV
jgi:hypothetical protein